jgi:hypothetical protein
MGLQSVENSHVWTGEILGYNKSKNSGNPITKMMVIRKNSFLANQMAFMSSMNIPINEEYDDLMLDNNYFRHIRACFCRQF